MKSIIYLFIVGTVVQGAFLTSQLYDAKDCSAASTFAMSAVDTPICLFPNVTCVGSQANGKEIGSSVTCGDEPAIPPGQFGVTKTFSQANCTGSPSLVINFQKKKKRNNHFRS